MKILNNNQVLKQLNSQFGIKEINGNLVKFGEEKIFLFTGDLELLEKLEKQRISIMGVGDYFAKEQGYELRLSIEGTHLLKEQITKNIFELNQEQKEQWMHGHDLQIKTGKKGFFIIKYENDFLGTGKLSEEKISNFIPKNRRLKEKS